MKKSDTYFSAKEIVCKEYNDSTDFHTLPDELDCIHPYWNIPSSIMPRWNNYQRPKGQKYLSRKE